MQLRMGPLGKKYSFSHQFQCPVQHPNRICICKHYRNTHKISSCGGCSYEHFVFLYFSQRMIKYSESKLKCIKARNEYILQLEATNVTLNKYYGTDMDSLLDVSCTAFVVFSRSCCGHRFDFHPLSIFLTTGVDPAIAFFTVFYFLLLYLKELTWIENDFKLDEIALIFFQIPLCELFFV